MPLYPARALERAMKIKEVISRALSGEINWIQASEIIGISDRGMRRWRKRLDKEGYEGCLIDERAVEPPKDAHSNIGCSLRQSRKRRSLVLPSCTESFDMNQETLYGFNLRDFQ